MEKKTLRKIVICLSLFTVICAILLVSLAFSSKIETAFGLRKNTKTTCTFRYDIIDVGQGAASLVSFDNGKHMLIDAGTNSSEKALVKYLKDLKITKIDYFVITHSDNDHTGGADAIYNNFEVLKTYRPFILAENDNFSSDPLSNYKSDMLVCDTADWAKCVDLMYKEEYKHGGENVKSEVEVISDQVFEIIGTVGVRFFWPVSCGVQIDESYGTLGYKTEKCSTTNNYSPVIVITYFDIEIVVTGDADQSVENAVINNLIASDNIDLISDVDIYVAGHHGSNGSSGKSFLEVLLPKYIAVQCGQSEKHPHKNFLSRVSDVWKSNKIDGSLYRTDKNGSIVFMFDGTDNSNVKLIVLYDDNSVYWWQIVVAAISFSAVFLIVPIIPKKKRRRHR